MNFHGPASWGYTNFYGSKPWFEAQQVGFFKPCDYGHPLVNVNRFCELEAMAEMKFVDLPGLVNIQKAIEHGHRNSEFSY